MGAKPGQRVVVVNAASFSAEIQKFTTHQHLFASHSGANNMWVDLDFNDADFEEASVRYINRLLSEYYSGWNNAEIEWHC
jgi:hypothetical protein